MATRRDLMEDELTRLRDEAKVLEREWRRVPWLFAFIVTAVPAHLLWGPVAALYAVLFTPCLVGAALYLVGVRRAENKASTTELEGQLRDQP